MTPSHRLTFGELVKITAGCLLAVTLSLFAVSELHRIGIEQEAAARIDAGVTWRGQR